MGLTEEAAREAAEAGGYGAQVAVVRSSFKANSKALAEKEGEGIAKMIYRCTPKFRPTAHACMNGPLQFRFLPVVSCLCWRQSDVIIAQLGSL